MYGETLRFPAGFAWGASTAAYQIEGSPDADGKGKSVWDDFTRVPGNVADGRTGDVACDHYRRYGEDIALMKSLNVGNYRMSVAWTRVLPEGTGSVNRAGLDFYDRLVDGLLENGVTPWITLFHWDLPSALQKDGGFANRKTVDAFLSYADAVTRSLGDRVKNWMTFNEPWVYSFCGHLYGVHAPGVKDLAAALAVAHNILVAHGKSIPVIKANVKDARVGIVNNLAWIEPASDRVEDVDAARRWDLAFNKWFMDPLFGRPYPEEMVAWYGARMPKVEVGDMAAIATRSDFLGINYYTRRLVAANPADAHIGAKQVYRPYFPRAEFEEWEINPEALYRLLVDVRKSYGDISIYISENGTSGADRVSGDGCVHDPVRVDYLRRHFAAAWQAIADGVDVRGYFVWSLYDNFEWGFGFTKRFGVVYTDYENGLRRIVKDSGHFFADVSANNGFAVD
jgi:beta-glucosidase